MPRGGILALWLVALLGAGIAEAWAQTPAPPAKPAPPIKKWTSSVSAGVTITRGNKDAATYNAGYDVRYDPKTRNIFRSNGMFIRGTTNGEVSANRIALNARDEYRANGRFFVFAQAQSLRDRVKAIEYLVAPTAGFGFTVADAARTKMSLNVGVGGVWEKNVGRDVRRSGAATVGEKFTHAISPAVTLSQSFSGLWKTENFRDALLTLTVGLTASMTTRTQFKVEWIDTYKSRPPSASIEKNDFSVIVALVVRR
jgi:putative salt-induced outer membrane protein YdiY